VAHFGSTIPEFACPYSHKGARTTQLKAVESKYENSWKHGQTDCVGDNHPLSMLFPYGEKQTTGKIILFHILKYTYVLS